MAHYFFKNLLGSPIHLCGIFLIQKTRGTLWFYLWDRVGGFVDGRAGYNSSLQKYHQERFYPIAFTVLFWFMLTSPRLCTIIFKSTSCKNPLYSFIFIFSPPQRREQTSLDLEQDWLSCQRKLSFWAKRWGWNPIKKTCQISWIMRESIFPV